jgi:hypothetical protein
VGLLRTNKVNRHDHIVYLRKDFTGDTSTDKKHSHVIEPLPDGSGAELLPADDGHSHVLAGPLSVGEKERKKSDTELIKEVRELFKSARELESKPREQAEKAEKMYGGEQWKDSDRQSLEAANRACLTINEIEPKIDLLSGYQRQNRQDLRFLPIEGGDAKVAELLNVVVKNICDSTDVEYEETEVFEDALIAGRGMWHVYLDRDENLEGDLKVEYWPQKDVYFGPFNRKDQKDLEYLCKVKWFSKAKLEQLFPDKAKDLKAELDVAKDLAEDEFIHDSQSGDRYSEEEGEPTYHEAIDPDFINIAKKEFRLIECWRKEYKRVPVAFSPNEDFYESQEGIGEKSVSAIKTIPGLTVAYQKIARMRVTTIAGGTLLVDEYPEDHPDDFNIIPVYAKKRGNKWWGKVWTAIDMQNEINKRHSQSIDILNKCAAYGWFYDNKTFPGPQEKSQWIKNSSSPGFNQEVINSERPPTKVEGTKFPVEIVQLEQLSTEKLREIMNINPELLGINSRAESGVAIAEKKRQGLVGNEFLFDNLAISKKRLGRAIVRLIQVAYTPERIMRIVNNANSRSSVEIAGKPLDQYDPAMIEKMLRNADLTKYDVAVTESAYSPTNRRYNFIVWSELAGRGVPVPPDLLIELSDLGDKEKVKQQVQQMKEEQAKMEKAKIDAEIQKTLISAQSKATGTSQQ